eukprot:gene2453-2756_t
MDISQNYECQLMLHGSGNSSTQQAVVLSASLHCSPPDPPLQVGFNSSMIMLNDSASDNYSGVNLVTSGLSCLDELTQQSVFGLLYFCGASAASTQYTVTLMQPTVSGVQLPLPPPLLSKPGTDPPYDLAMLVFGGRIRAIVKEGRFADNTAGTPLLAVGKADLTVTGSSAIVRNTAYSGGGVKLAGSSAVELSDGSVVKDNVAVYGGGVHMSGDSRFMMFDSSISNNKANMSAGGVLAQGTSRLRIERSYITGNRALQDGGGGFVLGGSAYAAVHNSSVVSNVGQQYGGGFYVKESASVSILDCRISENTAEKQGGGLALEDHARCNVSATLFERNFCMEQGAALYAADHASAFIGGGSSLRQNMVFKNGAAAFVTKSANLTVAGPVLFEGNSGQAGAAINMYKEDYDNSTGCVLKLLGRPGGITFRKNVGETAPAIVARAHCVVDAQDVWFVENVAQKEGGAVSLYQHSTATFNNCLWFNNSASDGGAVSMAGNASAVVRNSLVNLQRTSHNGGAFAVYDGAHLVVSRVQVTGNSAFYGGALYLANHAAVDVVDQSNLWSNAASVSGGAAYLLDSSRLSWSGSSKCQGNSATSSAGCVLVLDGANLSVSHDSRIIDNRARVGGGVAFIAWTQPVSLAQLQPPVVVNNTAASFEQNLYIDFKVVDLSIRSVVDANSTFWLGSQLASPAFVLDHVSRSAGGGLQVNVGATGFQNRSAAGLRVQALLLGGHLPREQEASSITLSATTTNDFGIATFSYLGVRRAPGPYTLRFEYVNLDGRAFRVHLWLRVRPCERGEVSNSQPDVCDVCGPGRFSLDPLPGLHSQCLACTVGMNCSLGGAVVLPTRGFWTATPASGVLNRSGHDAEDVALPSSVLKVLVLYMQYMVLIGGLQVSWPAALSGPFTALAGLWSATSSETLAMECLQTPGSNIPPGVLRVIIYVCVPLAMFMLLLVIEWPAQLLWLWITAALNRLGLGRRQASAGDTEFVGSVAGYHKARMQAAAASRQQQQDPQGNHNGNHSIGPGNGTGTSYGHGVRGMNDSAVAVVSMPLPPALTPALPASAPYAAAPAIPASDSLDLPLPAPSALLPAAPVQLGVCPTAAWCGVLAMVILFFFFPSLARAALGLFMCVHVKGDAAVGLPNRSLWMFDTSQACWGPSHSAYALGFGIPLLLTVFVGMPAGVGCVLWFGRRRAEQQWLVTHFGFLFVHFRSECYMWEVVTLVQTLVVVVVSVLSYQLGAFYQALLLNAVLVVIAVMLLWFRPFTSRRVQYMAVASLGCQLLTSYAAMSFMSLPRIIGTAGSCVDNDDDLGPAYMAYKAVVGAVILIVNVLFLLVALLVLLHALSRNEVVGAVLAWGSRRLLVPAWRRARVPLPQRLKLRITQRLNGTASSGSRQSINSSSAVHPAPAGSDRSSGRQQRQRPCDRNDGNDAGGAGLQLLQRNLTHASDPL